MPHSLQCPQCDGAVTVNDRDAGSRVKCPHCNNTFVAPGTSTAASDDDDWLKLDDDDAPAQPVLERPELNLGDDEFIGVEEPLPTNSTADPTTDEPDAFGAAAGDDDLFGDLPPMVVPPAAPASGKPASAAPDSGNAGTSMPGLGPPIKNPAPSAGSVEHETEFRLNCPVCGSMMFAQASQEGKTIKCGDCHSQVVVPPPPKVRPKQTMDIENAETFQFEEPKQDSRREDPFRKSAADLLQDAEQAEPEKETDDFEPPNILEWAGKVFGIFTDLNVMIRWIILSLVGSVPVYLVLSTENRIAVLGMIIAGVLFSALLIACGFAILQSVANDEPSVEEWPSIDPMEWLGSAGIAFAAVGFAGVPALALSQFIFDNSLIIIAVTMLSIYTLFPFVLLSMLDMQTITMPFSPEVARSVSSSQESWGGFYFSAGLLFFGLFLVFVATAGMSAGAAALISVFATVGLVFTYFAMIGRLAFAIGQSVNEPPREDDIEEERSRPKDD